MLNVDYLLYICIEFQVLCRVGVRFNGSNLFKKSDWMLFSVRIWTIRTPR